MDGSVNLADWTVNVDGVDPSPHLKVREKNGTLVAGWSPQGTMILLQ